MKINQVYADVEPKRAEVDGWRGYTVLEFGAPWCGYCRAAQPLLLTAFAERAEDIRHIKIEDGKGLPLGRSYRITLWPTLIFLKHAKETARLVRPSAAALITNALDEMVNS